MIELHLNRLISDESSFEKINGKFSKGGAEIRVEEMASILQEVQNQLPRDDRLLQELHWYIPLLSCSEDKIAMKIMQISLERFKEKVENLVQNLEKWQGKHEKRSDQQLNKTIQSLQELINGPYVNAICSLHKKILDGEAVDAEILFSVDELKELDFFLVPRGVLSAATSAQNPDSASISSMFNNMYKSTLALLQPFAAQAASYRYQSATNYDQVRKQDLLDMFEGKGDLAGVVPISKDGIIQVPPGGTDFMLPTPFYKDFKRADTVLINGKKVVELGKNSDLYSAARLMYLTFGRVGAHRIMQLCHQGIVGYPLINWVMTLCVSHSADGISDWMQKKSGPIVPEHGGGLIYEIEGSPDGEMCSVCVKTLMKLFEAPDQKYTAHYVIKCEVKIPIQLLLEPDEATFRQGIDQIHYTDTLSRVIVDNATLADKVWRSL